MCLKPQPPRPMPPELAAWGARHLVDDDPYKLVGDTLYEQYHDEDFADLYHKEGKPGLSPVLLSFVTVFQAFDNLPDRKAAEALEVNLKWKYALHLPLDAGSFDSSVLCEFRQRLLDHSAEARVFDQVLTQMHVMGLVKTRGIQRTDSLALFSRARELGRLELVFETMRVVLRDLLKADADWLRSVLPPEWATRYRYHCRAERQSDDERATLTLIIGDDGQWLLSRLDADDAPDDLKDRYVVSILRTVWEQHFEQRDGTMQFRKPGDYDGKERIQTPYDVEARWSEKHGTGWTGYKLQVTETEDAEMPHLITDIAVTPSIEDDRTALPEIQERQQQRDVLPGERYVDKGYTSGPNLASSAGYREDLRGPLATPSTPQSRLPDGLTHADFQIDLEAGQVSCPGGHTAALQSSGPGHLQAQFKRRWCEECPLRPRCCTGKGGRAIGMGTDYPLLQQARARQETTAFKDAYKQHRPGVEGCLSVLVRGHGIRVCRYAGKAKNHLRALFVGVAANLARAAAWLAGKRHRPKRQGLALAAVASG
ncbi:MAG: transposase [Roseiflexaceae bacterium]